MDKTNNSPAFLLGSLEGSVKKATDQIELIAKHMVGVKTSMLKNYQKSLLEIVEELRADLAKIDAKFEQYTGIHLNLKEEN